MPSKPLAARAVRSHNTPSAPGDKASRGDVARLRVLNAAVEEFAANGYRGTSTRTLAAQAGVNLAGLSYYFGGKPQLYRAALDHVVRQIDEAIRPVAEKVAAALAGEAVQANEAYPLLLNCLDSWLDIMLGRSGLQWKPSWSLLLTRAAIEPPEGDDWLYHSTASLILKPAAALIAKLLGRPSADEECQIMAIALLGQASAFRRDHDGRLPALGWSSIDAEQRQAIRSVMHRGTAAALVAAGADAKALWGTGDQKTAVEQS
ncbi:CerR family C-terminal domain-containing protein [Acidisoma cellulosilytica]|uniref:CerR family C-terminal domain-containing protein n=1 Tax=Acidisoma cellulosilyticum TaxID=2802395 RepID=A0A964E648_9PROT|nr:CerR family C-terminal domain-containing protein [Acidisoma cellulosilyticum]MCB8883186.1 CerR family C-terminal domain-containing protein [Acidisoma cellulosilyticum]